jgi:hypothetical protein
LEPVAEETENDLRYEALKKAENAGQILLKPMGHEIIINNSVSSLCDGNRINEFFENPLLMET